MFVIVFVFFNLPGGQTSSFSQFEDVCQTLLYLCFCLCLLQFTWKTDAHFPPDQGCLPSTSLYLSLYLFLYMSLYLSLSFSLFYLEDGRPLSPRSRMFAKHVLEDFSFSSNSFILFCIMMLFLVMSVNHRDLHDCNCHSILKIFSEGR